jgi:prepilin-type N-terminal cleavage/methylation domain-containing protein
MQRVPRKSANGGTGRSRGAFTLIELMTAMGLLAMAIGFAAVIFKVSINSYRTASANAQIIRKMRALTEQLEADFTGAVEGFPMLFRFEQDPNDDRFDQVMLLATGDFRSVQLYTGGAPGEDGKPLWGNTARIHYGQAQQSSDPNGQPGNLPPRQRTLARRQHILTPDTDLEQWPEASDFAASFDDTDPAGGGYCNERYEHESLSVADWRNLDAGDWQELVDTAFTYRPLVDMADELTYHKLMCEGVSSFSVQWAWWDAAERALRWYPDNDPDGDPDTDDSDFERMNGDFGVILNARRAAEFDDWHTLAGGITSGTGHTFEAEFRPAALKFTFTVHDSQGVIDGGRDFTHIVSLRQGGR